MKYRLSKLATIVTHSDIRNMSIECDARNDFYENYITHTRKLEAKLAEYLEVKYVIATHCCTHALHLAALSLGLGGVTR